jgi:Transmembrane secretion effector
VARGRGTKTKYVGMVGAENPAFVGLWLPSVVSGVCVSAHDTAATWLMNALGVSSLLLSLIATAASLPGRKEHRRAHDW